MLSRTTAICLDTNTYTAFFRGDTRAVELVLSAGWVCLPVTVVGELRAGFLGGTRHEANELALRQFMDSPQVRVVGISAPTTIHYARIAHALRQSGTPIPMNDVWIAASAMEFAIPLFSLDKHFALVAQAIPELTLVA